MCKSLTAVAWAELQWRTRYGQTKEDSKHIKISPLLFLRMQPDDEALYALRRPVQMKHNPAEVLRTLRELHNVSHMLWQEQSTGVLFTKTCKLPLLASLQSIDSSGRVLPVSDAYVGIGLPRAYMLHYPLLLRLADKLTWPDISRNLFTAVGLQSQNACMQYGLTSTGHRLTRQQLRRSRRSTLSALCYRA